MQVYLNNLKLHRELIYKYKNRWFSNQIQAPHQKQITHTPSKSLENEGNINISGNFMRILYLYDSQMLLKHLKICRAHKYFSFKSSLQFSCQYINDSS